MVGRTVVRTITSIFLVVCVVSVSTATDYYVDGTFGDDGRSGLTWDDAFVTIGKAMACCSGTSADAIHVAASTYSESVTFKSCVALLGGYPAGGGTRDSGYNVTVLDGGSSTRPLTFQSVSDCRIDGFTIQNGYSSSGGAVYCDHSSPTIEYCTISDNTATDGGGLYFDGSSPTILDCEISSNSASGDGGGIFCDGSSPIIRDTVIDGNTAGENGGGMFCDNSSPPDTKNCLIKSNSAGEDGGGVFCDNSSPTFLNCTFSLNEADGLGGALFLGSECSPVVVNSILWGDEPDEIWGHEEKKNSLDITYSNVHQDGFGDGDCGPDDNNNINCDPYFESRGGETRHNGFFLDQGDSPSVSSGDTEVNPYGGSSNLEYVTDVVGYLDMTSGDEVDMGYHYKTEDSTYIEMVSFEALAVGHSIVLRWETGAEIRNAGFALFREIAGTQDYRLISNLIAAQGTPASGASYSYTDNGVEPGITYNYWLVDIETSGAWTAHGPVSARLPGAFTFATESEAAQLLTG